MMKIGALVLLALFAVAATTGTGEAGRNKRGWYQKKPGAHCVMRKVVGIGINGAPVVRKVRVCG